MKNCLTVVLAGVATLGFTGTVFAQQNRQVLPGDNPVALTEDTTVRLSSETDLYKDEEGPSPLDRKVSIRVSNVPIPVFLNSITTQAKINFIMSEEFANKKVTASLTRVTVREALDTLLRVHGLAYQRIGKSDSYVVTKRSNDAPDTITKIYTLSYIALQNVSPSGGGSRTSTSNNNTSSNMGSTTDGANNNTSNRNALGGGNASDITGIINSMLTPAGRIAVDARTNKLIITDVAEVFPQIENILAELDIKPPQILIEAQIVEVSKTSGLSLGFEYGGSGGTLISATGPKRKVDLEYIKGKGVSGWNFIFPSAAQLESSGGSGGSGGSSSGGEGEDASDEAGLLDFSAFNIVLKSLLTRGEAKYLGKPKVVTLNNQTATITATTNATIGIEQQASGESAATSMLTETAERAEVGLTLNVTPQVNREGYVTLLVEPSYSDVVDSGFADKKDPTNRSASTLVRVKNGQTVVIGGILTSREMEAVRKVPLLGDIPILGWLFTSKTTSKNTTDLVIFITPTILAE